MSLSYTLAGARRFCVLGMISRNLGISRSLGGIGTNVIAFGIFIFSYLVMFDQYHNMNAFFYSYLLLLLAHLHGEHGDV